MHHTRKMNAENFITQELDEVLSEAVSCFSSKTKLSSEIMQEISNVVECYFIHGLKDPFFFKGSRYSSYPEPNFWPFVSKYVQKNIKAEVDSLNQIKNEIGKARAWVRIVLNQRVMESYLDLFYKDENRIGLFYLPNAFILNNSIRDCFASFLKSIFKMPFEAAINSRMLNAWTPRPLFLAGLISECLMSKVPRKQFVNYLEEPEIAINAIELLDNGSQIFDEFKILSADDDTSSIYSHPSIVDSSLNFLFKPALFSSVLASTPENACLLNEDDKKLYYPSEEQSVDVVVYRRRQGPSSRSSNGTSRSHSRDHSLSNIPNTSLDKHAPTLERNAETRSSDSGIGQTVDSVSNAFDGPSCSYAPEKNFIPQKSLNDVLVQSTGNIVKHNLTSDLDASCSSFHDVNDSDIDLCIPEKDFDYRFSPSTSESEPHLSFDAAFKKFVKKDELDSPNSKKCAHLQESFTSDEELINRCKPSDSVSFFSKQLELPTIPLDAYNTDDDDINGGNNLDSEDIYRISKKYLIFIKLPQESGLDHQQYRCPSCRRSIGGSFGKFRLCHLTGLDFCDVCLRAGSECIIPSRLILNWDSRPRQVSKGAAEFLNSITDQPFIRIDKLNNKLYEHSRQMKRIYELRTKLSLAVIYLFSCKKSIAEDMRRRISPQEYLYKAIHLYSISDLENCVNGVLERHMNALISFALSHIYSCSLCLIKGFICEICSSNKVIYPFQIETTDRCKTCFAVYHKECFLRKNECSKCVRRSKYTSGLALFSPTSSSNKSFSMSQPLSTRPGTPDL